MSGQVFSRSLGLLYLRLVSSLYHGVFVLSSFHCLYLRTFPFPCVSVDSAKGSLRRSEALTPSFRKRKATTSSALAPSLTKADFVRALVPLVDASESVPSSTMDTSAVETSVAETSASSSYHLIDENDDHLAGDENLMPHMRRVMDAVGKRSATTDVGDCGFVLRETATLHIRESPEASPKTICLEDTNIRPDEAEVEGVVGRDSLVLPRHKETSSSGVAVDVSPLTDDKTWM